MLTHSSGTLYEVCRLPPLTGHVVWPPLATVPLNGGGYNYREGGTGRAFAACSLTSFFGCISSCPARGAPGVAESVRPPAVKAPKGHHRASPSDRDVPGCFLTQTPRVCKKNAICNHESKRDDTGPAGCEPRPRWRQNPEGHRMPAFLDALGQRNTTTLQQPPPQAERRSPGAAGPSGRVHGNGPFFTPGRLQTCFFPSSCVAGVMSFS